MRVLIADDEPSIRLTVEDALRAAGFAVDVVADGAAAQAALERDVYHVLLSDVRMPKQNGLELFRWVRAHRPQLRVILMTAYAEVQDAVQALKDGAEDYLTKPFDLDELVLRVQRVAETEKLRVELQDAREQLSRGGGQKHRMVGRSKSMLRLFDQLETMADSDAPVLIYGESGTGKELVARALHAYSPRKDGPFVAVNCAAFPESLIEAELFGHEKGAFTGAVRAREGRFRAASGGTLFLDELGEISPLVQAKLLRTLQEHIIEPLGSEASVEVDVRIIAATHRDLKARIQSGEFREDLFYRINVLDLKIPPLRERRDDVPLLVEYFLSRHSRSAEPQLRPEVWAALSQYPFPGNVRELEHAIERACVLSRGQEIQLAHLPEDIGGGVEAASGLVAPAGVQPLQEAIRAFERTYLAHALDAFDGKKAKAAEALGISRKSLWEKLKDLP